MKTSTTVFAIILGISSLRQLFTVINSMFRVWQAADELHVTFALMLIFTIPIKFKASCPNLLSIH
jgi:hypothetical protein